MGASFVSYMFLNFQFFFMNFVIKVQDSQAYRKVKLTRGEGTSVYL